MIEGSQIITFLAYQLLTLPLQVDPLSPTPFSWLSHTMVNIIIIIDCFYIALFSALEQIHCALTVMFMNNFEFKINNVKWNRNGNFILVSFSMNDKDILLVNVYGLNRDTPAFYEELTEMVKEYQNHCVYLANICLWSTFSNSLYGCTFLSIMYA